MSEQLTPSFENLTRSIADPATTTGGEASPPGTGPLLAASARYRLGEEIARGGMGIVYRATDTVLGREVAVKVLQADPEASSVIARRFADEAHITAQLQHPAIPPVHDLGTLPDGRPFLAMKLIKGETLEAQLKARPDPTVERGRFIAAFEQVCHAIAFAHDRRVIHRDLKPSNVMVGAFAEVQVMDWGLAKVLAGHETGRPEDDPEETAAETVIHSQRDSDQVLTRAGSVLGTPAFMPPEQALGAIGRVDTRSDVFGLGAILAVILTGRPPFAASSAETTRIQAAQGKVEECFTRLDMCGADPELVALTKRCLSPTPADRPAHAGEVARAVATLRAAADERARQAELDRAQAEAQAIEQRKRRRVQTALVLTFTALVVLGGAFAWWQDRQITERRSERERLEAAQRAERDRDRAVAVERSRQGIETALVLANDLRDKFRFAEAQTVLENAAAQIPSDAHDIRDRADRARADLALVRDLDRVRVSRLRIDVVAAARTQGEAFRAVFLARGVDPSGTDPAATDWVIRSPVRDYLVMAIDNWAEVEKDLAKRDRLLAVGRKADPGAWSQKFRDPAVWGNSTRLAQLVQEADLTTLSPHHLSMLFRHQQAVWPGASRAVADVANRHRGDFWVQLEVGYHFVIKDPQPAVAVGYLRAALALRPDQGYPLYLLADSLERTGDTEGTLTLRQEMVRLARSGEPSLPAELASALLQIAVGNDRRRRGDIAGAIAAFRESTRLDPRTATAWASLGTLLRGQGDRDGAIAALQEAIRLAPRYTPARFELGAVYLDKGQLGEAIAVFQQANRLDPANFNVSRALQQTTRMRDLLPRLPDILAGRAEPRTPREAIEFAELCAQSFQKRFATAVRLYDQAFAADPKLALLFNGQPYTIGAWPSRHSYNAACCALLAAAGRDAELTTPGVEEWGFFTDRALGWLRSDLAALAARAESPATRSRNRMTLTGWKIDADLVGVRDPEWLAAMPPVDRRKWEAFWADVDALLTSAAAAVAPPPREAKR